jgi:hypothetical protein
MKPLEGEKGYSEFEKSDKIGVIAPRSKKGAWPHASRIATEHR